MHAKLQNLIVIATVIFSAANAFAAKTKCPSKESLANELLQLELAGRRYQDFPGSCVHQLKSAAILMRHDSADDSHYEFAKNPILIPRKDKIEITEIEKDNFPDRWVVHFQWKDKKESFVMETFGKKIAKKAGCAAIATPPKNFYVYSDCVKKNK